MVARAARRALAEIPAYAERVSEAELREGIARDLGLAMAALVEERELSDEDRATMSVIGDSRARQGLPVEGMVHVYRITIDEVFAVITEAADDGLLAPADALALMRRAWDYAGPIVEGAVGAYRRREVELAVADSQRSTELVRGLLLSSRGAPPELIAAMGLDPAAEYVAIRARADGQEPLALLFELKLPGTLDGGLVAPYEGDVIGLTRAAPTHAPGGAIVAVGARGRLDQLSQSFDVASRVVEAAAAYGLTGVLGIESVALEAVARAEGTLMDALVRRYVEPVQPSTPAGAALIDTVSCFLEHDLNAEEAAERMGVHPNTIRNRLRRFEELTGASLDSVRDLAELRLALLRVASD